MANIIKFYISWKKIFYNNPSNIQKFSKKRHVFKIPQHQKAPNNLTIVIHHFKLNAFHLNAEKDLIIIQTLLFHLQYIIVRSAHRGQCTTEIDCSPGW